MCNSTSSLSKFQIKQAKIEGRSLKWPIQNHWGLNCFSKVHWGKGLHRSPQVESQHAVCPWESCEDAIYSIYTGRERCSWLGTRGKRKKSKLRRGARWHSGTQRWDMMGGANDGGQGVKPQKQYWSMTTTHCNQCVWWDRAFALVCCLLTSLVLTTSNIYNNTRAATDNCSTLIIFACTRLFTYISMKCNAITWTWN